MSLVMGQKILLDIKKKGENFRYSSRQINLSYQKVLRVPLKNILSAFFILFFIVSFVLNSALAPTNRGVLAAQSVNSAEERKNLEAQLAQLEAQMNEYEKKIGEYKKQGNSLQSEIKKLNDKISRLGLQIKAVNITLQKLDKDLVHTQSQIVSTEDKISIKKKIISQLLQEMYQKGKENIATVLLANNKISDAFNELSHLNSTQDKLRVAVNELSGLRNDLMDQKEQLALEKNDALVLKNYQEEQKSSIQKTKTEKDDLLKTTKGKESEYKKILAETQKTAAQIRNRLFELIGGGELKFEDAYKFAKFAETKTNVRAALVLAVLDRESALGKNVGKCNYKDAMHPTRDIPVFLQITKELDLNPETTAVSCPITRDGAYGGAMGPAQFLPSTWTKYRDQVASLTGDNPPSPWKNIDAFMATALFLKNAGADAGTINAERMAAAKYYAGSRWKNYLWSYGEKAVARAREFQQDINTLNA